VEDAGMMTRSEGWLAGALAEQLDEARGNAVAAIQRRYQRLLLEPGAAELVTIATCDVGLLLDEVARLQNVRRRQTVLLTQLQDGRSPAAGCAEEPHGGIGQDTRTSANQPQDSNSPSSLKGAVANLQAAIGQCDWRRGQAALDTISAELGMSDGKPLVAQIA
jgi:hypothetical protein